MGLEDFKTENETTTDEEEVKRSWPPGIDARKWKSMSKEEQIEYIRDNYVADYYPDFQPDKRWDWKGVVELTCVCGEIFTFLSKGMCMTCGRVYENVGRTVRKIHDPEEDTDQEDNGSSTEQSEE